MIFSVGMRFAVTPPRTRTLHYALEHVHALVIDAPTSEIAEAHADEIRRALEAEGDR